MLAAVLATLVKLVVILKLGLRSISKRITSLIFLNIYILPKHALTHNSLCFKIIDKAKSKFDLKIKEKLYINWRKPYLNAQQNLLAFFIAYIPLAPFCLCLFFFFFFVFLHFSVLYCFHYLVANYRYLLLS